MVTPHQTLVEHVRAEFLEMPGLQLTCEQAHGSGASIREPAGGIEYAR
jgi:hypothetical protein